MFENNTYSANWVGLIRYRAHFDLMAYREGDYFDVYKGKAFSCKDYIPRSVVVKGMRHYCGEQEDFEMYRFCSEQSRKIAIQFNKLSTVFPCKIRFVVPAVTQIDTRSTVAFGKKFNKDEYVAFEEKLEGNFTTFIDKRGNTLDGNKCCLILEAFSHYSFVVSEGNFVICGLQGVYRKDKSEFILTNPTIHSREGKFGPGDKRDPGIRDVTQNHTCNKFCQMFMNKPSKSATELENEFGEI
ncbi:uncharacterized protein LOC132738919 [Ruditapes philippinarum]|uniref:uncharacterized protein LOC132738919 n=1 Tax=Ruditapes philippinarum TaxID=129788 RepID=UPI00295A5827|nr:uncharacterized protein LOC132738919 [Ruditapes philippinarum]